MDTVSRVMQSLPSELQLVALEMHFPHLVTQAELCLKLGIKGYRETVLEEEMEDPQALIRCDGLMEACQQVLDGKGLSADSPFEDLNLIGFYEMFELFNFRCLGVEKRFSDWIYNGKIGLLEMVRFECPLDGSEVTYFYFIRLDFVVELD